VLFYYSLIHRLLDVGVVQLEAAAQLEGAVQALFALLRLAKAVQVFSLVL